MADVLAQFAILPQHILKRRGSIVDQIGSFWQNPETSGFYTIDEFMVVLLHFDNLTKIMRKLP